MHTVNRYVKDNRQPYFPYDMECYLDYQVLDIFI